MDMELSTFKRGMKGKILSILQGTTMDMKHSDLKKEIKNMKCSKLKRGIWEHER